MKPPPFSYVRAESLEHALQVLDEHGDEAKLLSGGQSLLPLLNLRLARPAVIVDVNRVDLTGVGTDGGELRTGALVRHRTVCLESDVRRANPLLSSASGLIGHTAIRNRGTVGGSIAHADSAAELVLVAVATDAVIEARSAVGGAREIPARAFFHGPFMTALEPQEAIVAVRWPMLSTGDRWGFREIAERSGDFATAAAAVLVRGGAASVAVTGVPGAPRLLPAVAERVSAGHTAPAEITDAVHAELRQAEQAAGSADDVTARLVARMVVDAVGQSEDRGRAA